MKPPPQRVLLWLILLLNLWQPVLAANDRGLIYCAVRGDTRIWLLGSVHVGDASLYPLRPAIVDAFAGADRLVVELDVTRVDPVAVAAWIDRHGTYPEGETLRSHLQPTTWRRLERYLHEQGIDPASIERQKPGLLVTMLSLRALGASGLHTGLGIDQYFLDAAAKAGKPVVALETLEEQLGLLAAMPNPDLAINATLDDMAALKEDTDTLIAAWKSGDIARLEPLVRDALLGDDPASREFFEKLLRHRNHLMADRLIESPAVRGESFVVVGAAHLVGPEGLPALLQKSGFEVEQR